MNYTDILSSKFEPETTGTTIMAVIYDGGLIIGADSRTSSG